jgi:tetratricopeptide (TPR) repeat protein
VQPLDALTERAMVVSAGSPGLGLILRCIQAQEAAMSWFRTTSLSRTCGLTAVALACVLAFDSAGQTPNSFVAMGSYAQQPPVKTDESPHFAVTAEMQGDIFMARQRYVAALDAYRMGPTDSAVLWNKMGIANHHMFNLREAERDYEKALRLNPNYAEALNNLGAVYYGEKNYKDAERAYKKAIKLSPKSATFYSNLGTAYVAQEKYKKGADAYRTALQLDPNVFDGDPTTKISEAGPTHEMAELNYLLAKAYAEAGRKDEALYYLRKALDEGFNDRKKILEEKEFAGLKSTPEFQQIVAEKH